MAMQHGETGAALPRHLAKQRGRMVCDTHNCYGVVNNKKGVNPQTGLAKDRTGTFTVEVRTKGKQLRLPTTK